MANTYSSIKRIRQTVRATEMNRQSKSRLRTQIRAMREAVSGKDPKAAEALLPKTFSIIDRSAAIGIIKREHRCPLQVQAAQTPEGAYAVSAKINLSITIRSSGRASRMPRSAAKISFSPSSSCSLENFATV